MCNLYSLTKGQQAIRDLAGAMRDTTGSLPLPDYSAPIARNAADGARKLSLARMPPPGIGVWKAWMARLRAGSPAADIVGYMQQGFYAERSLRGTLSRSWSRIEVNAHRLKFWRRQDDRPGALGTSP